MKHFLLVLLILPLFGISQVVKTSKDFSIDVGSPYPVVDAPLKEYFYHNEEVLAIKIHGDITFQKFNANSLDQKSRSEVSKKKALPKGFVHEEFIQQGGRIFEFYNVWDKPNKTEQIFVQEINFDKPSLKNNKLLFKVSGKLTSSMGKNKIDIYQSFDQSRYLLVYRRKPTEKRDKLNHDKIGMMVFDKDMNPLWKKEVTMPYTEKEMDNLGYTIDSKGNAYMLARVRKGETPHLEILKYDGGDKPEITEVNANGKYFPHGITLQEGKNGVIYCAGFYGEGSSANGIYVSVLDKNGIKNEKFHDIPLSIINQNKSDRAKQKNAKKEGKGKEIGIYELGLDNIKINPDGSLLLYGEVFYVVVTRTHTANGGSQTTYHYYYKEMFVSKIDTEGELVWMNKLVKNQHRASRSSGGFSFGINSAAYQQKNNNYDLSYKYMSTENSHYFLYLDNLKNLTLPDNKYPAQHLSGKGGFLTAYKIDDKTGEVSKLSLFDMKNVKGISVYQFNTDRIVQASDDEILVELYKKKKEDLLLRININE